MKGTRAFMARGCVVALMVVLLLCYNTHAQTTISAPRDTSTVAPTTSFACDCPEQACKAASCVAKQCVYVATPGATCQLSSFRMGSCNALGLCEEPATPNPPKILVHEHDLVHVIAADADAVFDFGQEGTYSIKGLDNAITNGIAEAKSNVDDLDASVNKQLAALSSNIQQAIGTTETTLNTKIESQISTTQAQCDSKVTAASNELKALISALDSTVKANAASATSGLTAATSKITVNANNLASVSTNLNTANTKIAALETARSSLATASSTHESQLTQVYSVLKLLTSSSLSPALADLTSLAKSVCHERGMGYTAGNCITCADGYDPDFRACRAEHWTMQRDNWLGTDHRFPRRCNTWDTGEEWELGIWPQEFYAARSGTYQIYFKSHVYLYGIADCWSDREAWIYVYPVVDGIRRGYCQYNYIRGWGRNENEHDDMVCDFTITGLAVGQHTVSYDIMSGGNEVRLYGAQYQSTAWQRWLPSNNKAPPGETTAACKASTGNVLQRTWIKADYNIQSCGGWSGFNSISANFNSAGPWAVTTRTGIVHFYFKAHTYLYGTSSCYSDEETGIQTRVLINGVAQTYCDYVYERGWFNSDNHYGQTICEFIYKVAPNTVLTFDIQTQHLGNTARLYSNQWRSALHIEDMPPPAVDTPDVPPTGCNGQIHRRMIYQGNLKTDFAIAGDCTAGVYRRLTGTYLDMVTVTVSQTKAQIRVHFKAMTYLYGQSACLSDYEAQMRVHPVINNSRKNECAYHYMRGWGTNDNQYRPLTCDITITLSKGTHTIELEAYSYGRQANLYGGNMQSVFFVEEIPHDLSTSTA